MQIFTATFWWALLLGVSGISGAQVRIAGGGVRQNGDLKYMVEIRGKFLRTWHQGSGILLSPDWVLTTKVAATPAFLSSVYVSAGKSKGADGIEVAIENTFDEPNDKVLTLLKLKEAVKIDDLSRPANLPFQDTAINSGQVHATLSGWGDGKELKAVTVTLLTGEDCKGLTGTNLLCSADVGTGACKGDDGSPVVQDLKNGVYKLLGLATNTAGTKECPLSEPTAYVSVAPYTNWIIKTMLGLQ